MSMDISANFKIAAGVVSQAAVDNLNKGVDKLNTGVSSLPRHCAHCRPGDGRARRWPEHFRAEGQIRWRRRVYPQGQGASEVTGSSIDKIGAIVQASKITGDDFPGKSEAGIAKMNKALAGSDDEGEGCGARALDALGSTSKELRTLDLADAFDKIAKAIGVRGRRRQGRYRDGSFGKSGAQLCRS